MLSQAQLDLRKSGIGSSEISAVVDVNPFCDKTQLWLEKVGLAARNENRATLAGQWLEDGVAARAAHEKGWTLQRCNRTLRHRKHSWVLATPDRFLLVDATHRKRRGIAEIKTSASLDELPGWGEEGSHVVPPHIHCQCQWQMTVTGLDVVTVVLFTFRDREQRYYEIPHSPALEEALLDAGNDFWHKHVLPEEPPPMELGRESTSLFLAKTLRQTSDTIIEAPLSSDDWAVKLFRAKSDKADAEARETEAENAMKEIVGEARGMKGPWGRFLWSYCKGKLRDGALIDHLMDRLGLPDAERAELRETFRGDGYRRASFTYNDPTEET